MLALLFGVNLLNYIDRYVLAGVLPLVEQTFAGITKERLGLLAPAFLVVYMITSPVFGVLGDRVKRWLLVGIGVQLWSLATAASGLARSFWQLFFTRMFVGVGEAAYGTTAPTLIADLYPRASRGKALSLFYVAIPVGSALGYLVGGAVGTAWSWHAAFFVVGVPGLLVGTLAYLMPEPTRGCTEGVDDAALSRYLQQTPTLGRYLDLTRIPSFLLNTAGMTAYTYAVGGISFWMPTYLAQDRGLPLATATFWFGLVTVVAGILGTLLGGALADALARRHGGAYFVVCGVSMLLSVPAFYTGLVSQRPAVYWVAFFLAELMLFANTGPSNTIMVSAVEPALRTGAVAANIFVIHTLGDVISPVIMGRIADRRGLTPAFLSTVGVVVLSGLLWLAGTPFLERDTRRVAARMSAPPGPHP